MIPPHPMTRRGGLPGALSFLLPGLGHLYLRDYLPAGLFFAVFTVVNAVEAVRWYVPFVLLAASGMARRSAAVLPEGAVPTTRGRDARFLAVGFVGIFAWVGLLVPQVTGMASSMKTVTAAQRLSRVVVACAAAKGALPPDLSGCAIGDKQDPRRTADRDAWGNGYRYEIERDGFALRSFGRDGRAETEDDLLYHYRVNPGEEVGYSYPPPDQDR